MFEDWELPVHAEAAKHLPPPGDIVRPSEDTELTGGDVLDFGGGARVVAAPGHTDGSIALYLPAHGVPFTEDTIAASPTDGNGMLGVSNLDRQRTLSSFRELALLDTEVACFGHGDPVPRAASTVLREAAETYA